MRRTIIAAATVIMAIAVTASPAAAGHGNKANAGPPDNAQQDVQVNKLTSAGSAAASFGRAQLDRTDITMSTGGSDLHVYDAAYNASWYGQTSCTDRNWLNGKCDHMDIKFNTGTMGSRSTSYWQSLGCHEFGHSGGLGHRFKSTDSNDNSCMRDEIWPRYLDTHDIDAVNAVV
ncbi:hypothetical protein [Catellatospora citrea]|uniref:Matrixin n=1 Tax=Catellatospora citrea TaxID=53366 RepID=A0A8J3KHL2_9ACTN|nr:hypothetical protein [Catellatospora citrea]RKE05737.1 hypothetical protein C8E86_0547 [Catellatospora citrea]GIF97098.1 hypothetical protein Cci01nite_21920 [Catellatospora citrea]